MRTKNTPYFDMFYTTLVNGDIAFYEKIPNIAVV